MDSRIIKKLKTMQACSEAIEWAATQPSAQTAWDNCERGDYMLWLLGKFSGPPESKSRKKMVLAACACARLSLKHVLKGEGRPRLAIAAAENWAKGKGVLLEDVRSAAHAAVAYAANAAAYAADAAANAAYAADAADAAANAAYAAHAAAYAANAAAHAAAYAAADAARAKTLKRCADIVRTAYPKAPRLGGGR